MMVSNFEQLEFKYELMLDKIHDHVHFQIEVLIQKYCFKKYNPKMLIKIFPVGREI